jgi:hypothetical protein
MWRVLWVLTRPVLETPTLAAGGARRIAPVHGGKLRSSQCIPMIRAPWSVIACWP